MALIKCPKCGKEISDTAANCNNCGNSLRIQTQQSDVRLKAPKKPVYKRDWFIVIIIFFALCIIIAVFNKVSDSDSIDPEQLTTPAAEEDSPAVEPGIVPVDVIDVDYIDMWENYTDEEYKDKWVRIIGKIEKMRYSENIYFKDGLPLVATNYLSIAAADKREYEEFSDGDYAVVVGLVKKKISGMISIENAIVEPANDSDMIAVKRYEKIRDEKKAQMAEDYKNSAETVSYDELVREPSKYEGKVLEVTLEIVKVLSEAYGIEIGYVGKASENEWRIQYEIPEGMEKILPNDTVTFYGEFAGLSDEESASTDEKEYIPEIEARYYEIN